ncbi:hypothetical protein XENORESO_010207 [Xenotaenia resolanae]|uniref:Uncharacterized protein n=1 Tax=Xenotaenia resolanae TaxID=208358 RepID=A0ABV0VVZ9_9TELE
MQQKGPGFNSWPGVFLHVLSTNAWVLSGFLPQFKNMTIRLVGLSKLPLGVKWCVHGFLSCVSLCSPEMNCQPVQDEPCLTRRLLEIGISSPSPCTEEIGIEDGWMDVSVQTAVNSNTRTLYHL